MPLLLQRPGVVFAELKAECLNKKEGGKPRSSEESRGGNVSCCELWDCQPQQVLTGIGPVETPRPFQPLPAVSWD